MTNDHQYESRLELEQVRAVMAEQRERRGNRVSKAAAETGKRVVGGKIDEAKAVGGTALTPLDINPQPGMPPGVVSLPDIPAEAQPVRPPFDQAA